MAKEKDRVNTNLEKKVAENLTYHEVYEKYKNLVLKVAYDYSGDYDMAEDIMQSTFMTLYMYFDEMHHGNLKSWLYTTAKHKALNYRKRAEREILRDEPDDDTDGSIRDFAMSAEDEVIAREAESELTHLHDKIFVDVLEKNPRWYEAIMLVYFMKIPQAKVADEMGIPINVLHSMLHRAKEWIRKEYGVEYQELNRK